MYDKYSVYQRTIKLIHDPKSLECKIYNRRKDKWSLTNIDWLNNVILPNHTHNLQFIYKTIK